MSETARTHAVCWHCKTPLDEAIAHCKSKHCPWCRACAAKERT